MNKTESISIHERSISFYGHAESKDKICEELAELIQAIMRNDRSEIINEAADVYNVLEKLKVLYSIKDSQIEKVKFEKMNRLANRMGIALQ